MSYGILNDLHLIDEKTFISDVTLRFVKKMKVLSHRT